MHVITCISPPDGACSHPVSADRNAAYAEVAIVHSLSQRELNIAEAVATGMTNGEVATVLFISRKTVENHLSRIYAKLQIRSRSHLTRLIINWHHRGSHS